MCGSGRTSALPEGFSCPQCGHAAHTVLNAGWGSRKTFQCQACRHQISLIAGTLFQSTHLPLTLWFLAIYLISEAKTGLSSLALKRTLGVSYPTAWRMHHKLMQAMAEREKLYTLEGQVQVDDAYLGGERTGGKVGRGSENKVPFVAAGNCQAICRTFFERCLFEEEVFSPDSRWGLRKTASIGVQFLVSPDHRSGFFCLAA